MGIALFPAVDLERVLREEVGRLGECLDVLVPLLRPRRGWVNRLVTFLKGTVI